MRVANRIMAGLSAPVYLYLAAAYGLAGSGFAAVPSDPFSLAGAMIALIAAAFGAITFAITGSRG